MTHPNDLRNAIASVVAAEETGNLLPSACKRLGIVKYDAEMSPYLSYGKHKLVMSLLAEKDQDFLIALARRVVQEYSSALNNNVLKNLVFDTWQLSEVTKRNLVDELLLMGGTGELRGRLDLVEFLKRTWDLDGMPSTDGRFKTASSDIWQHMINNDDWDDHYLLKSYLGVTSATDQLFFSFVEQIVHPLVRDDDQEQYVEVINKHLQRDGFKLKISAQVSGYPIYKVESMKTGVGGNVKNLIFAANGPKPEIVLSDAVENNIVIVKNAEYCLVYDLPIPDTGFLWQHLIAWWANSKQLPADEPATERELYKRLLTSLASEPEKILFDTYFRIFSEHRLTKLPALIPQVYLHYDPYTTHNLSGQKRLPRQRMDFLILFSKRDRIVIEIDGKQHYSENKTPSPPKYAELVAADRQLRLDGYEVFRFGGFEFVDRESGKAIVEKFFHQLFRKYDVFR